MKKLAIATVMAAAMVAIVSTGIKAAEPGKTVKVKGLESLEPNAIFLSNLKFAPGAIKVRTSDTVTWVDDARTAVPHTITIVDEAELPVDFAAAYTCLWDDVIPGVTGFCLQFLDAHGGPGGSTPVVDVGGPGLDTRGDSLPAPEWLGQRSGYGRLRRLALHVCHPSVDAGVNCNRREGQEVKTSSISKMAKRRLARPSSLRAVASPRRFPERRSG